MNLDAHDIAVRRTQELLHLIGHDFRGPLLVIDAFLHEIREKAVANASTDPLLDRSIANVELLRGRLQGALRLLKLDLEEIGTEPVSLGDLVQEWAQEHKARIDVEMQTLPIVAGSVTLLQTVIREILDNSEKFVAKGARPKSVITVESDHHGVPCVVFRDWGVGFRSDNSSRLYQLFSRFHQEDEFPGLGAGLAIAKRILELHGGDISVHSEVGHGTTARIWVNQDRYIEPTDQ